MSRIYQLVIASTLATHVAGCGDSLAPPWLIERARTLGARIEVSGEPDRASPAPGDTMIARWITATPDGAPAELAWTLALCGPDSASPLACLDDSIALASGNGATPELDVEVPPVDVIGSAGRLAIAGVICERGTPDASLTGCDGPDATATLAIVTLPLAGTSPNHNPSLADSLTIDGQPWPEASGRCEDPAMPRWPAGRSLDARWYALDRDREAIATNDVISREVLQLSTFVTAGDLDSHFTIVESTDNILDHAIEWSPPTSDELAADLTPVHFTFVLRDGRGGLDATTRTLCVTR